MTAKKILLKSPNSYYFYNFAYHIDKKTKLKQLVIT